MEYKSAELKLAFDFALMLAQRVSKQILKDQRHIEQLKVSYKKSQGVVSEADLKAEGEIIKAINKKFPDHSILAEETSFQEHGSSKEHYKDLSQKEWLWIIDPLDGTNNYLNGLDYYAISIALCYRGRCVMGLVYRPSSHEVFYALKEKGAFYRPGQAKRFKKMDQERTTKKLTEGLFATGFVSEKGKSFDREFKVFKHMMGQSRGIRRMGSAVLDLCYVASGQFDGFWEKGLAPWDTAAAAFICEMSGVRVTDYDNTVFLPFHSSIVAARRPLHSKLIKELS